MEYPFIDKLLFPWSWIYLWINRFDRGVTQYKKLNAPNEIEAVKAFDEKI